MRQNILRQTLLTLATIAIGFTGLYGQSAQSKRYPEFQWGFSERLRFVAWNNAITLDDQADGAEAFTRHRSSFWGRWLLEKNLHFSFKLTNEFRYHFAPEDLGFTHEEIIIDQLYFKWTNRGQIPGILTVGRQDIILGEGFLVMDGGPFDGSRSMYFNAVRYDWQTNPDDRLTVFYCYQPEEDDWFPVFNDQDTPMIEQPEEGLGLYYQTDVDNVGLNAYYLRKNVKSIIGRPIRSAINTFGARVQVPMNELLSFTAEGAHQVGSYGDNDRIAFGGYFHFDYETNWKKYYPQFLSWGMIYLSGDKPETDDNEGWDPMFARWPKWSESYIYTQIPETGVAYWTNMASFYGKVRFDLAPGIDLKVDYHHLLALRGRPITTTRSGKTRGDLLIARVTAQFDKHWSGHFLWETFAPGSFYEDSADGYTWARLELKVEI